MYTNYYELHIRRETLMHTMSYLVASDQCVKRPEDDPVAIINCFVIMILFIYFAFVVSTNLSIRLNHHIINKRARLWN